METSNQDSKNSKLVPVLREGVCVVQMVLFKELRSQISKKYIDKEQTFHSMLTGAIINELFGIENPEERIQNFRKENIAAIEQELLALSTEMFELRPYITDAIRIQTLCDQQEGSDSSAILIAAEEMGVLITERELPLPSTFMTRLRLLGEKHGLTMPPVQLSKEDDQAMLQ
jgi:hypothetical protein